MGVGTPFGLEKILADLLHQNLAHRRKIEDIRITKDRVLAHFDP